MADPIAPALEYAAKHPQKTIREVADACKVPKSTLSDRINSTHLPHTLATHSKLSVAQEQEIITKISEYADRGTLLTPAHVKQLGEAVFGETLGRNWATTFIKRHQTEISSSYYAYKELGRYKADTPDNRKAFYELVKRVYDSKLYQPSCIFNMDECGFNLTSSRRTKKVAPRGHPRNGQTVPPSSEHITVVACIGTNSAPVRPLVIYQSKAQENGIMEVWTKVNENWRTPQVGFTSLSGFTNSYIHQKWLEDVFDPDTLALSDNRAKRRLLFLDGADAHIKVQFLELCWARNIVCVILPSNLSGRFQPLDVDFFNHIKKRYHDLVHEYQLGTSNHSVGKGMFWGWHQRAWRETATQRQIRAAWAKSGLWPNNRSRFDIDQTDRPSTPPSHSNPDDPDTPTTLRILRRNSRAVRRGNIDVKKAYFKQEKVTDGLMARNALLERELEMVRGAQLLDKEARGSKKREIYPVGEFFDPVYQAEHKEELAIRKAKEQEEERKKRAAGLRKRKRAVSPEEEGCTPGPSGTS